MYEARREIDELTENGNRAAEDGHLDLARGLYAEAARLDEKQLASLPESAHKTRGIVSVNVATLYAQAGRYDYARRFIYRTLSGENIPKRAEQRLEELLSYIQDMSKLDSLGEVYVDDSLGVALRGGEIGTGSAPADVAVNTMRAWHSLVVRFAEAALNLPYRPRGPVSSVLVQALAPRISQPLAGSYRFELKLSRGKEVDLFQTHVAVKLVSNIYTFLSAAFVGDLDGVKSIVQDEQYRETILELTKSVVPTGRSIGEAGITIHKSGKPRGVEDMILRPELRAELSSLIKRNRPGSSSDTLTFEGTLRGVQLNREWIMIDVDGQEKQVNIESRALEDVIGPMVNHHVRAEVARRENNKFWLINIDPLDY